ncbi:EAL domain-containing protein [Myxosarcina sp. GI1]|uniref:two-component system response regulator n=1 Tax=Myxosarcina sp. GI1 TaxID=1541065 RepID=UPI0005640783|nr:EAL domain-containing protein [Myxosarcina sp. GI1]
MNDTKILIVEDELLIAKGIARDVLKSGYKIEKVVSSGQAALEQVKTLVPDLILMDIAIKGKMNGIETAAKIRENNDIPIIFLTAYADEKTIEQAVATGGYGYILKPYKVAELNAAIKMALNKHREKLAIRKSLQQAIGQFSKENLNVYQDNLTGIPNQLFLRDLFENLLTGLNEQYDLEQSELPSVESLQSPIQQVAVIYINLDKFQRINDSLSSDRVNFLIRKVVDKFIQCKNHCDRESSIIRLKQSEFVILLADIDQKQIAGNLAQNIIEELRRPLVIDGQEIFLTASIGISLYPLDGMEVEQLIEQAKNTMKHVLQQGGDQYKFYSNAFALNSSSASHNLFLEAELHHAIEQEQLEIFYQPKIELKNNKILGMEALLRWNHPKLGRVSPDKFIPIAEQSSLIEKIGEWVLEEACRQTKIWHERGFDSLKVAVNLSGRQFKQLNLFHKLSHLLMNSGLEAKFLQLELTEQILVENIKVNIQRLNFIKKLGIQIALDDFGRGYSSLGYLQQFPFDILKIDRCFVSEIDRNKTNAVITKTIIEMAHQLDLKVVAEGVETQAELKFLMQHNCDEVQGYLFSRPLPAKEFEELLKSNKYSTVTSQKL